MSVSNSQPSEGRHVLNYALPCPIKLLMPERLEEKSSDTTIDVHGCHHAAGDSVPVSPCTRPLLARPQAREEHVRGLVPPAVKEPMGNMPEESVLTTARKKALLINAASCAPYPPTLRGSMESCASLCSPAHAYTRGLRLREATAIEVAAEHKYVQEWGFFMKCYSEGRFNLSRPPDPPPCKADFTHLPAPPPLDEIGRIKAFKRMNVAYPNWALKRARHLIIIGMRNLQTEHASLSFFDRKDEVMRAESGYDRAVIPRHESIGAHLLLSNEAMVLLDTHKDWRMKGNPLVQRSPYIRFYAAAPLITPEGYVVGAFAVFDPRPKDDFPVRLRQKLAHYARMAMTDLRKVADEEVLGRHSHSSPEHIEFSDKHNGTPRDQATVLGSNIALGSQTGLVSARTKSTQRAEDNSKPADGSSSDVQTLVADVQSRLTTNQVTPRLTSQSGDMARILSLALPAPRLSSVSSEPTFPANNLPTPPDSPTLSRRELSSSSQDERKRHRKETIRTPSDLENIRRRTEMLDLSPTKALSKRDQKEDRGLAISPSPPRGNDNDDTQAPIEASTMISAMARNLGWDFVYVLRIRPGHPTMNILSQDESDTMFTQLVLSHGTPDPPPIFSYALHLRALRSAGGLIYRNTAGPDGTGGNSQVGYNVGVMFPLLRHAPTLPPPTSPASADVGQQQKQDYHHLLLLPPPECPTSLMLKEDPTCDSGLLLGAFHKSSPPDYEPSLDELAALRRAGYQLGLMLVS